MNLMSDQLQPFRIHGPEKQGKKTREDTDLSMNFL